MTEIGGASRLIAKELEKTEKHGAPSRSSKGKPPVGKNIGVKTKRTLKPKVFKSKEELEPIIPVQPIGGISLDTEGPDLISSSPGGETAKTTESPEEIRLVVPEGRPLPGGTVISASIPPRSSSIIQKPDGTFVMVSIVGGKVTYIAPITDQAKVTEYTAMMPEEHGAINIPIRSEMKTPVNIEPPASWQNDPKYRVPGTKFTVVPGLGYVPLEWWKEYEKWYSDPSTPQMPKTYEHYW